jgi:hypothetical protein
MTRAYWLSLCPPLALSPDDIAAASHEHRWQLDALNVIWRCRCGAIRDPFDDVNHGARFAIPRPINR